MEVLFQVNIFKQFSYKKHYDNNLIIQFSKSECSLNNSFFDFNPARQCFSDALFIDSKH